MGLFFFLKFLNKAETKDSNIPTAEYAPSFWEDDYCQVEIVPSSNKDFILSQSGQIEELIQKTKTDNGFSDAFIRKSMPVTTLSEEIRITYLEKLFESLQLEKAKHIYYNGHEIINCETSKTKAFGFTNFSIFFEIEEEFVKNIWVQPRHITDSSQIKSITNVLYILGEECQFVLIDWNSQELVDLANLKEVNSYMSNFK